VSNNKLVGLQKIAKKMKTTKTKYLVIFLVVSLGVNLVQLISGYVLAIENKDSKNEIRILNEERNTIIELIPKLQPAATRKDLADAIKSLAPTETVEILKDQVGWRFYHFWFGHNQYPIISADAKGHGTSTKAPWEAGVNAVALAEFFVRSPQGFNEIR
jgi:hypothetical protein